MNFPSIVTPAERDSWIAHADRYHGNNKLLMGGAQRPTAVLDVADLVCPH
ncbi:MAG: hypothetical protein ABSH33_09670 [Steroidobacteraceae bacterium]|jgi:hypothetical protein